MHAVLYFVASKLCSSYLVNTTSFIYFAIFVVHIIILITHRVYHCYLGGVSEVSGVILSVVTPSARLHEGCNPDSTHSSVNTPWSIVVALRSYISVQGKWLVSNCPLLVGFTGLLEGNIWVGGGGGA